MRKKLISIVVPTYNEEKNVGLLYEKFAELASQHGKYNFEFIFSTMHRPMILCRS